MFLTDHNHRNSLQSNCSCSHRQILNNINILITNQNVQQKKGYELEITAKIDAPANVGTIVGEDIGNEAAAVQTLRHKVGGRLHQFRWAVLRIGVVQMFAQSFQHVLAAVIDDGREDGARGRATGLAQMTDDARLPLVVDAADAANQCGGRLHRLIHLVQPFCVLVRKLGIALQLAQAVRPIAGRDLHLAVGALDVAQKLLAYRAIAIAKRLDGRLYRLQQSLVEQVSVHLVATSTQPLVPAHLDVVVRGAGKDSSLSTEMMENTDDTYKQNCSYSSSLSAMPVPKPWCVRKASCSN